MISTQAAQQLDHLAPDGLLGFRTPDLASLHAVHGSGGPTDIGQWLNNPPHPVLSIVWMGRAPDARAVAELINDQLQRTAHAHNSHPAPVDALAWVGLWSMTDERALVVLAAGTSDPGIWGPEFMTAVSHTVASAHGALLEIAPAAPDNGPMSLAALSTGPAGGWFGISSEDVLDMAQEVLSPTGLDELNRGLWIKDNRPRGRSKNP